MSSEIGLVCIKGSAPLGAQDSIASALMDKHLCEFASTSMPKASADAFVVIIDAPSTEVTTEEPEKEDSSSRATTASETNEEYHLRYIWDPSLGSSVEDFINIFISYKEVQRCTTHFGSTRGTVPPTNFLTAIKEGLAADGGLFMPQRIPLMPYSQLRYYCEARSLSYLEAAEMILPQLVDSTISPTLLNTFMKKAYHRDRWSDLDNICPVRPLLERQQRAGERWTRHVSVLELYHGPTAAFKDFALQLFPYYFHLAAVGPSSPTTHGRKPKDTGRSTRRLRVATRLSVSASFLSGGEPSQGEASTESTMRQSASPEKAALVFPSASRNSNFVKNRAYQQFMRQKAIALERAKNSHYLILAATSGDTGVAAISGFQNLGSPSIKVAVLYPLHGVSPVQQLQMQSMDDGRSVRVIGVKSDFDFCQSTVKNIFSNTELKDKLATMKPYGHFLSSANSINWGRLIPQVAYYFWCYRQLFQVSKQRKEGILEESALLNSMVPTNFTFGYPMDVVVPCGNFGNILAAFIAKLMGLPIRTLVVASNENDVLYEFIHTGRYTIASRTLSTTASPSIDILVASNVERFVYLLSGGDAALVSSLMHQLTTRKSFTLPDHLRDRMQETFWAGRCTEEECGKGIRDVFEASRGQRLLDTHTGVAVAVAQKYREEMLLSEEQAAHLAMRSEKRGRGRSGTAPAKRKGRSRKSAQESSPLINDQDTFSVPSPHKGPFPVPFTFGSVLDVPLVVASTAHWSKFPDAVYNALRGRPLQDVKQPAPSGSLSSRVHSIAATSDMEARGGMLGSTTATGEGKALGSFLMTHKNDPTGMRVDGRTALASTTQNNHQGVVSKGEENNLKDIIGHTLFCYHQIERLAMSHHFHVPLSHPALRRMLDTLYTPHALCMGSTDGTADAIQPITALSTSMDSSALHRREIQPNPEVITAEVEEFCKQTPMEISEALNLLPYVSSRL